MKGALIIFTVLLYLCNSQVVISGYTQLSDADIQSNAVIQSLAQVGADNAPQVALAAGNLPNSDTNYKLTQINTVHQQGTNYRYNITLTNANNGLVMIAIFIINYQPATKTHRLVSESYNILPHGPVATVTPSTSTTTTTTVSNAAAPSSSAIVAPVTTAATATTTTAAPAVPTVPAVTQQAGGYTLVPPDQVQGSPVILSLAQLGARNLVSMAVNANKLPTANSNFSITAINSVYQQVVNGINYKFDVTLINSDGVIINGNYVINYQPTTNATLISSSTYNIPAYLPANAQNPIVSSSSTAPSASSSAPIQMSAGGYTSLSIDEINNNPTIQSLAAFGARDITQQAINAGKIASDATLTVSNINSVSAQVVNGINYKFNVNLVNADKSVTIVAAYIVYYQSWTNTRKVLATSYVVAP